MCYRFEITIAIRSSNIADGTLHDFPQTSRRESQQKVLQNCYTAALRLGIQTDLNQDKIEIRFRGTLDHSIQAHQDNMAFRGEITVEGKSTPDVIVILREGHHGRYQLISFWPDTQHPDAHKAIQILSLIRHLLARLMISKRSQPSCTIALKIMLESRPLR